ncbi:MAG: hypothetical protein EAY75_05740 [Bacteroidetes bacterium]|nr:MAG: hypothetical protein EAY75_05740 [Bacteroidota bacterium]
MVGKASLVIVTVLVVDVQPGLLIVHTNTYVPDCVKPLACVFGSFTELKVISPTTKGAGTLCTVHAPVPTIGVLPAMSVVLTQIFCPAPATATVGGAERLMIRVDSEAGQVPLEIVHLNTFTPTPILVTCTVGLLVKPVNVPLPLTNVQLPVPMAGALPCIV